MGKYFNDFLSKVSESASFLKKKIGYKPKVMVALTGGVDGPLNNLTEKIELDASEIPHFPGAKAQGHAGKLIFGKYEGEGVILFVGRSHYYEGHLPQEVVFPYFVMRELGVDSLITTNAVGGIRHDLNVGDIMVITDHINAMGDNPLRAIAVLREENQFTDMTAPYDTKLQEIAREEAKKLGINLKEGVFVGTCGPSYETRSEIKMFRGWGADAVGMSTVFEVIACNFLGIRVLCLSCVANPAADRHEGKMSHKEVLAAMDAAGPRLSDLVVACLKRINS